MEIRKTTLEDLNFGVLLHGKRADLLALAVRHGNDSDRGEHVLRTAATKNQETEKETSGVHGFDVQNGFLRLESVHALSLDARKSGTMRREAGEYPHFG